MVLAQDVPNGQIPGFRESTNEPGALVVAAGPFSSPGQRCWDQGVNVGRVVHGSVELAEPEGNFWALAKLQSVEQALDAWNVKIQPAVERL